MKSLNKSPFCPEKEPIQCLLPLGVSFEGQNLFTDHKRGVSDVVGVVVKTVLRHRQIDFSVYFFVLVPLPF